MHAYVHACMRACVCVGVRECHVTTGSDLRTDEAASTTRSSCSTCVHVHAMHARKRTQPLPRACLCTRVRARA